MAPEHRNHVQMEMDAMADKISPQTLQQLLDGNTPGLVDVEGT
jgi:hypothetical protein